MRNRSIIRFWCLYDWANSAYSLVIVSAIFPIYFAKNAINEEGGDLIHLMGISLPNSVWFSYTISATFLVVACISPLLSGLADRSNNKKKFLALFCLLGAISCMSLFFFTKNSIGLGLFSFFMAGIGYSASIVFYNAFLPEIAPPDQQDRVSALGFSYGYVGSVILLIFNLTLLLQPQWYGHVESGLAARISFLSVGVWWLGFGLLSIINLPETPKQSKDKTSWLHGGYKELLKVYSKIKKLPRVLKFLRAFFFYNMGVQTVMYVATIFAEKELALPSSNLIVTILILQLLAIPGALGFSYLSTKIGNPKTIACALLIWIIICLAGYFVQTAYQFYALAALVGSVMGGIQSISRSTFSKLIPVHNKEHASFFSFYDVCDKLSTVIGTFAFGWIELYTGSARNSIVMLAVFFILGVYFISKLFRQKQLEANTI